MSLKVTGAQGQGINSVGEMCAKGLKRGGYCVFGYKEYMSLIKGGHSSYQLDISSQEVESTETKVDLLVCFNHHGLEQNWSDVKPGGVILHQTPQWKFPADRQKAIDRDSISVIFMPTEDFLKTLKAPPIIGNILITAVVWGILGRDPQELKNMVKAQFGHKGEKILGMNYAAIDVAAGWVMENNTRGEWSGAMPEPDDRWTDHLLLTGSEAMGLGLIHAGCRMYVGYPMTPSSQLLSYISGIQNETGMIVKQAEDEITAAQMMSGAMLMGTRAATGTSGGGFDLMTETVSLNGIIENPSVFVLAQRPGPATGLPTWTAQGDLHLAVGSAHGEFPRLVIGVSDSQDCFDLMPEAFNYAEQFQTPVIVLTDKQIAEAIYTQSPYDQNKAKIDRGNLVTDPKKLAKLKATDRYDPAAKDGISPRWLPGAEAVTYCAQGDEHDSAGNVNESAENATAQMEKRMKKMEALKNAIPDPIVYQATAERGYLPATVDDTLPEPDLLIVSWGSNKSVILDAMKELGDAKIAYVHYTYLWPLKTDLLQATAANAQKTILIECNHNGQLGCLIKQECGMDFDHKILKYDGRPFFVDELVSLLTAPAGQSA